MIASSPAPTGRPRASTTTYSMSNVSWKLSSHSSFSLLLLFAILPHFCCAIITGLVGIASGTISSAMICEGTAGDWTLLLQTNEKQPEDSLLKSLSKRVWLIKSARTWIHFNRAAGFIALQIRLRLDYKPAHGSLIPPFELFNKVSSPDQVIAVGVVYLLYTTLNRVVSRSIYDILFSLQRRLALLHAEKGAYGQARIISAQKEKKETKKKGF